MAQKGQIKESAKKQIEAMNDAQMQEHMNTLSEEYLIIADRVSKDLSNIAIIQEEVAYCFEVLKSRGVNIDIDKGLNDVS